METVTIGNIAVTILLFGLGAVLFVRTLKTSFKLVAPQARVMMMTFNNENTALDLTNLRLVTGSMFQRVVVYPGHVQPIKMPVGRSIRTKKMVRGAEIEIEVIVSEILPQAKIVSAKKAFFHSVYRMPIRAMQHLIWDSLTAYLSSPKGGRVYDREGTGPVAQDLIRIVNDECMKWGVQLVSLQLGDFEVPEEIKAFSRAVLKSQAEAEAFVIERDAQGPMYLIKQVLDTVGGMENLRAIVLGGGENDLLGKLLALGEAMKDDPQKSAEKKS